MKMLIAALLLAATPAMAQDCQIINGALNCGNSSVTGQSYGNQLYFSNGTTATRNGDRTYFSDGRLFSCSSIGRHIAGRLAMVAS